jgi:hypothetical protein
MARTKRSERLASVEDNEKKKAGKWCPQALQVCCTRDGAADGSFISYTVYCIQLQSDNLDSAGKPQMISLRNPRILQQGIGEDKLGTRMVCQEKTANADGTHDIVNWILKMSNMSVNHARCSEDDHDHWTQVRFDVFFEKTSFLNKKPFFV